MADDFKVGDVVVCVDASPPRSGSPTIKLLRGRFYKVSAARARMDGVSSVGHVLVDCEPAHGRTPWGFQGWTASRFRKLPPASDEFTASIRACKPHNTRVPALAATDTSDGSIAA